MVTPKTDWEPGDRVRSVGRYDGMNGLVTEVGSEPDQDGLPRVAVRWSTNGQITRWSPWTLVAADQPPAEDPDRVWLCRRDGEDLYIVCPKLEQVGFSGPMLKAKSDLLWFSGMGIDVIQPVHKEGRFVGVVRVTL